jgi:hypothetical protein
MLRLESVFLPQEVKNLSINSLMLPERDEWFIEGHAFLQSYDSAPRPLPSPSFVSSCLSFSVFLSVAGPL